jgi:hypothetical protein
MGFPLDHVSPLRGSRTEAEDPIRFPAVAIISTNLRRAIGLTAFR